MRYVGIDPSTKTGLVILSVNGDVIDQKEITPLSKADPQRFMEIAEQVWYQLRKDDVICIEGFSYGSRGRGVSTQYGLGWLIRAELIKSGYTYHEVSPNSVKKFATGKGNSAKDAMVLPIFKKWGFEDTSDNVRDAYVLAQMARAIDGQGELTNYQKEAMGKVMANV